MSKLDGPDWDDGISTAGLWKPRGRFEPSVRNEELFKKIVAARVPLIAAALAWRDAAIADGWVCKPTYATETADQAFSLERGGWKASGLARPADDRTAGTGSVHVWGPDGLAVSSGRTYSWKALQAGLRTCDKCGVTDVPTHRAGFANRVCNLCLPAARKQLEYPGWTS